MKNTQHRSFRQPTNSGWALNHHSPKKQQPKKYKGSPTPSAHIIPFPKSGRQKSQKPPKHHHQGYNYRPKYRTAKKQRKNRLNLRTIAWSALILALIGVSIGGFATNKTSVQSADIATHSKKIEGLINGYQTQETKLDDLDIAITEQSKRITALSKEVEPLAHPPQILRDAQEFFRLGRFADAEASYSRFIAENQASRLTEIAIWNSSLANCQLGNRSMVRSRIELLKKLHPESRLNAEAKVKLRHCI